MVAVTNRLLAVLAVLCEAALAADGDVKHPHLITSLPGAKEALDNGRSYYSGHLEVTGGLSMFYFFSPHPDPSKPLLAWMQGGPGASSLMGIFGEFGPFLLNNASRPTSTHSEWSLFSNPHTWQSEASLLAWEQPAGVGYSRCIGAPCPRWDDHSSAEASLMFFHTFLAAFPSEQPRKLFIAGESYGGVYVPLLAERIHQYNFVQTDPKRQINLRGIAVGNGCTGYGSGGSCGSNTLDVFVEYLERATPAVSPSVLGDVRSRCGNELKKNVNAGPSDLSARCLGGVQSLFEEIGDYNEYHWGSPCGPDDQGNWGDGASYTCGVWSTQQMYFNDASVQRALHAIPEDASEPIQWTMWDGDGPNYNVSVPDVLPTYARLLKAGYKVLVYNGLRDTAVSFVGAEKWTADLGGKVEEPRRKWATSDGTIGGHIVRYTNGLDFVTVEGAGHMVPGDRPRSAMTMITGMLRQERLPLYEGRACKRMWMGRTWSQFCSEDKAAVALPSDKQRPADEQAGMYNFFM